MTEPNTDSVPLSSKEQPRLPLRSRPKRPRALRAPVKISLDRTRMVTIYKALGEALVAVRNAASAAGPGARRDTLNAHVKTLASVQADYDAFLWRRGQ